MKLNGYNLIRADHPDDIKRGGVCCYVKGSLAAKVCNINRLNECFILELIINNKKGYILSLYRSPSQSNDEFDDLLLKFANTLQDITLLEPSFIMILGDFNAKCSSWQEQDIISNAGLQIEYLASFYGSTQLISDPTHILRNSSSCIDLILTNCPRSFQNIRVFETGLSEIGRASCRERV